MSFLIPEIQKTQGVRYLDVTFIGPLMIIAGLLNRNKLLKTLLLINGVTTIVYNNKNYVIQEEILYDAWARKQTERNN